MRDKENRLYVVIRFTGNAVIEFYKALYDTTDKTMHFEVRQILENASEIRQTGNLLVFMLQCSELHNCSYAITKEDTMTVYSFENVPYCTIDVYSKRKYIEW